MSMYVYLQNIQKHEALTEVTNLCPILSYSAVEVWGGWLGYSNLRLTQLQVKLVFGLFLLLIIKQIITLYYK